jgi:hypothetical protein
MGATPEGTGSSDSHFERFDNADAAREQVETFEQRQRERKREQLELYGEAKELFRSRVTDTFTVERHGTEIEFHRPVGASDIDLSDLEDRELAERLKQGGVLIERFEQRQRELLEAGDDSDIGDVIDEAFEMTDLHRQILSAHAVDDSFRDPRVWVAIFGDDDNVGEVFRDFMAEGDPMKKQRQLNGLQNLLSDSDSEN